MLKILQRLSTFELSEMNKLTFHVALKDKTNFYDHSILFLQYLFDKIIFVVVFFFLSLMGPLYLTVNAASI